ncbi:hypothetical protein M413DRAFT_50015, partial [Hebeloma cylindrosporum]
MVFAGDFAQLPPAMGGENVSLYSRVIGAISSNIKSQEEAIGKALWHQVTTVVILRKNMRQQKVSDANKQFRKLLENLRYKSCAAEDIAFCRSLITSTVPGNHCITDDEFRNTSIITGRNIHKDEINRVGKSNATGKKGRHVGNITDEIQQSLWDQPPSSTDKLIAGKLSLCIGLPIIQFEGLPENVVPLTRSSTTIRASLPNDNAIFISRSQVEVLVNFAMTDFASQGKTRPKNPVDLHNLQTHQAYYTALSRSSTAEGTIILQGFDTQKMTGGASGALRQEFREIELLDKITNLRYLGKLHKSVIGCTRNQVIKCFREWKDERTWTAHFLNMQNGALSNILNQFKLLLQGQKTFE